MLTLDHIKEIENSVMHICNTCKTLPDLEEAAAPIWLWACHALKMDRGHLLHEISIHESDEHFSDPFLEGKDHLLKLPVLLLKKYHSSHH